ncbi:MAG: hypothetical protein ACK5CA_03835 [Cyanobacteriota bacterium]
MLSKVFENFVISIILAVVVGAFFWFWVLISNQRQRYVIEKPVEPQPMEGLILLLSPYNQRSVTPEQIEAVITQENPTEADFQAINLFNSNLYPQLKAIEFHREDDQETLRDLWLIWTLPDETNNGSQQTAELLSTYVRYKYGDSVRVHWRDSSVGMLDYPRLCELVEKIYQKSSYKDERIVADITGGTKLMSMAMSIACVPPKRRLQYMDSSRDWQGQPTGGVMKPVIIDIDPIVYNDTPISLQELGIILKNGLSQRSQGRR